MYVVFPYYYSTLNIQSTLLQVHTFQAWHKNILLHLILRIFMQDVVQDCLGHKRLFTFLIDGQQVKTKLKSKTTFNKDPPQVKRQLFWNGSYIRREQLGQHGQLGWLRGGGSWLGGTCLACSLGVEVAHCQNVVCLLLMCLMTLTQGYR